MGSSPVSLAGGVCGRGGIGQDCRCSPELGWAEGLEAGARTYRSSLGAEPCADPSGFSNKGKGTMRMGNPCRKVQGKVGLESVRPASSLPSFQNR